MEYDFEKFEKNLIKLLDNRQWDDTLDIGENISPIPEIKIAFDGHGDLETEDENGEYQYVEHGNKDNESYAIYIHKNSAKKGFEFPEHDVYSFTFGNMVQHRPAEEVCLFAWHSKSETTDDWYWDIIPLEDRISSDSTMTANEVVDILEVLVNRYYPE